ncbi:MAG: HEAT repeat domain-containing protein [Candidatus Muiribacteriota bacterium]
MNIYLQMLYEKDENVKLYALNKIKGKKLDQSGCEILFSALKNSTEAVQMILIDLLNKHQYLKISEYAVNNIEKTTSPLVKATLVKSLGIGGNADNIPYIVKNLIAENSRIRANAVESISQIKGKNLTEFLLPMKDDSNHRVRLNILYALYDYAGEEFFPEIVKFASSDNKMDRAACAHTLSRIHTKRVFPVLISLLKDDESIVRKNTVKALSGEKNITYLKHFISTFLIEKNENVKKELILAMAETDSNKAVETLYKKVKEKEYNHKYPDFLKALAQLKSDMSLSILTNALESSNPENRSAAIEAIGEYKNKNIVEILLPFLKDKDEEVQLNAAKILWKFGIMNAYTSLKKIMDNGNAKVKKKAKCILTLMGL